MDKKFWDGKFSLKLVDKEGKTLWEEVKHNSLSQQGEANFLDTYFRGLHTPTEFYLRLCNDTLDVGDTLTTIIGEPSGFGYTPMLIERSAVGWPTLEINEGAYRLVSKTITITAVGGDIGPVNTSFISTTIDNSGSLVAFVTFDVPRTILDGSSLIATYQASLQ